MLQTVLIIVLILILLGAIPQAGFHSYGWGPSGGVGLILIIILILFLMGKI